MLKLLRNVDREEKEETGEGVEQEEEEKEEKGEERPKQKKQKKPTYKRWSCPPSFSSSERRHTPIRQRLSKLMPGPGQALGGHPGAKWLLLLSVYVQ